MLSTTGEFPTFQPLSPRYYPYKRCEMDSLTSRGTVDVQNVTKESLPTCLETAEKPFFSQPAQKFLTIVDEEFMFPQSQDR